MLLMHLGENKRLIRGTPIPGTEGSGQGVAGMIAKPELGLSINQCRAGSSVLCVNANYKL